MLEINEEKDLIAIGLDRGLIKIIEDRIEYVDAGKIYSFKDPEEKVRAKVFVELVEKYKYHPKRIDFEVVPPRRVPKLPADIVVFEDDDHKNSFICVEVKPENARDESIAIGLREGRGNSNLLRGSISYLIVEQRELSSTQKTTRK